MAGAVFCFAASESLTERLEDRSHHRFGVDTRIELGSVGDEVDEWGPVAAGWISKMGPYDVDARFQHSPEQRNYYCHATYHRDVLTPVP